MGNMLPKPILSKIADRVGNYRLGAACVSVNGYRPSMEDAHVMALDGDVSLFGVFDGHNGCGCSEYIARNIPEKVKALNGKYDPADLERLCVALDSDFMRDVGDASGATGTFCLVLQDYTTIVCNVGDSRTLLTRAGKMLFVTEDHKPTNPGERDRIEACAGCVISNRVDGDLAVSRSFGDSSFKRNEDGDYKEQKVIAVPDVTKFACQAGDVIILACDGVFEGSFSNEEVVKFVYEQLPRSADLAVAAARVCDEAIRRGSKDNISCMIVRLSDGMSPARAYGAHSFVPGPPYTRTHEASRGAYTAMAQRVGLTVAEALMRRYALLKAYESKTLPSMAPLEQTAFEMSDEADIETEKNFFGRGPAPGNEAAFFNSLAEQGER
ncbi:putative phosphatase 2C [Trypanosoma conorhini]|uniref:Putative phosphatase 2C n=1 Tax=Trypanosoma conorhini TaxID=83891 RepID=A0A3R7KHI8_9TRYP|nr:putative phosphatase 2C [Trypanosoma conorhini]RNF07793.1 putative phosphatase 2C [Trypanosoma conorhini]